MNNQMLKKQIPIHNKDLHFQQPLLHLLKLHAIPTFQLFLNISTYYNHPFKVTGSLTLLFLYNLYYAERKDNKIVIMKYNFPHKFILS